MPLDAGGAAAVYPVARADDAVASVPQADLTYAATPCILETCTGTHAAAVACGPTVVFGELPISFLIHGGHLIYVGKLEPVLGRNGPHR